MIEHLIEVLLLYSKELDAKSAPELPGTARSRQV